jgi:hypothetical protein
MAAYAMATVKSAKSVTLREEFGTGFAEGYRSDTKLRTVLKDAGVDTLDQYRKKR